MNVSIPNNGTDMNIWREIQDWIKSRDSQDGTQAWIERNFVLSGFPDLWRTESWREALDYLRMTQTLFGLMEGS
jgi:SH3-like domain-containing protein